MTYKTFDQITLEMLEALERRRGDGEKMFGDIAWYRPTTAEENPDAPNQQKPRTLRGLACEFIRGIGGAVQGRELHYYMLSNFPAKKWDYGYVHQKQKMNQIKRGAARDWLRRSDVSPNAEQKNTCNTTAPVTGDPPSIVRNLRDIIAQQYFSPSVHEDFVRRVLKLAGYEDSEILVSENIIYVGGRREAPFLVLTIRRIWNLHSGIEHGAMDDAYAIAERKGIRFCGCTNGDYFRLQDRRNGLTFTQHMMYDGRIATNDDFPQVLISTLARIRNLKDASATSSRPTTAKRLSSGGQRLTFKEAKDILSPVIEGIQIVRQDANHQERDHESLLEDFLRRLGFQPYGEIKFRRGRVDLALYQEKKPRLIFEVKKNWNIEKFRVLRQAYKYCMETNVPYCCITNGDYYLIHQTNQGLSYQDNELGEFNLSSLRLEDLAMIEWIRDRRYLSD